MSLIINKTTGAWQDSVDDTVLENPEDYIIFNKDRPPTNELRLFLQVARPVFAKECYPRANNQGLLKVTTNDTWGEVIGFIVLATGYPCLIPTGRTLKYNVEGFTTNGNYPSPNQDVPYTHFIPDTVVNLPDDDARVVPVWASLNQPDTTAIPEPDLIKLARLKTEKMAANATAFNSWANVGVAVLDIMQEPANWLLPMDWTDIKFQNNKAKAEAYSSKLIGLSGQDLLIAQQQLSQINSTMFDVDGQLQTVNALDIVMNFARIAPKRLVTADAYSFVEASIQQATIETIESIVIPNYSEIYNAAS